MADPEDDVLDDEDDEDEDEPGDEPEDDEEDLDDDEVFEETELLRAENDRMKEKLSKLSDIILQASRVLME